MRIETRKIYTALELKRRPKQLPGAFEHAFKYFTGHNDDGLEFEISDLMGSLKGLFDSCGGIKLTDWNIGAYNRGNGLSVQFTSEYADDVAALSGPRAMAWIENNLLSRLRIPWTGPKRANYRKYGDGYKPGQIKSCPFTGMCYDDDLLDCLVKNVYVENMDLKSAFEDLARECEKILEAAVDYQNTEEYFLQEADGQGMEFDKRGNRI